MSAAVEQPIAPAASERYSTPAIVLHWAIALLVLANIYFGWRMEQVRGLEKFELFQLHKSVGLTVLILSLARLAWRLLHPPPPYPPTMKPWEKLAASSVHWSFYALMIGLPLLGWIVVSASPTNLPTLLYKVLPWPHIGPIHGLPMEQRTSLAETFTGIHVVLAWSMLALLVIHVGAAVKHQFIERDGVLYRMAPFLRFGGRR